MVFKGVHSQPPGGGVCGPTGEGKFLDGINFVEKNFGVKIIDLSLKLRGKNYGPSGRKITKPPFYIEKNCHFFFKKTIKFVTSGKIWASKNEIGCQFHSKT